MFLVLFACRTAMNILVFWKLRHSPTSFLSYNCHQFFLLLINYSTRPQVFLSTTAIKFLYFRQFTALTHNFLLLQLPTHQFFLLNFTGTTTHIYTSQLPFLNFTFNSWQSHLTKTSYIYCKISKSAFRAYRIHFPKTAITPVIL